MLLRHLFETTTSEVAIIFGRFNPPHKGHRAAWEMAAESPVWFVGTNQSTVGPKDPLPFDVKVEAMKTVWPEVEGHIVSETSWLTLASEVYKKHPKATLLCLTDEDWVTKTIVQYNGKEGAHGFYNFPRITQKPTPRLSSATALRDAVAKGDRAAFSQAAGVPADTKVAGKPFFDLVAEYLLPYQNAPKKVAKKKKEPEVAEGSLKEYGDTAKGQKMLTKVQKRAVDRLTSKKADTDPKYAKKNQDTANRAWDRMSGVEEDKNPHTSALGKALYRDLSKEKKASPAQVQRNKERWAKRQAEREQGVTEDWNKVNKQDKTDGLSQKAVNAYRRENPGSKLQTAVTKKPSELKPGSKDAKRRKSFCARMSGNKGPMKDEKGRPTPKAKALSRWNCNEAESKALDQTAKRLTDPKDGAVAKLRAAGDKRREDHLKSRDIAKKNEAIDLKTSLQELSNDMLGKYKKAAGADAKKADAAGDFKRGDKRFKGINRATMKQFDNDAKKNK